MADVNKEIAIAITANDQASSVINNTASSAQSAADKMKQTGTQARNAGIAMTGAGVLGLAASNNLSTGARTVEQSYAAVNTMLGAGEDAYDDYHKEVQRLITELPIAGGETEALAGLYQVLSAGIESGADATAVLESAMKASVAGMTSTEVAVDALTSVINAYGLTGEDATAVSDVLFTAVQRGKLTFESLNAAIGPVVAIAAQVGVGLEQVAASMAPLTKAGLQSDVAGTALKAATMSRAVGRRFSPRSMVRSMRSRKWS